MDKQLVNLRPVGLVGKRVDVELNRAGDHAVGQGTYEQNASPIYYGKLDLAPKRVGVRCRERR
jgi:hypothetical protein